nr:CAP domain-containing protein [Propionicimonas sp.]
MQTCRTFRARTVAAIAATLAASLSYPTTLAVADTSGATTVAASTISSVSPASGLVTGNVVVTIKGANLAGATAVAINGKPARIAANSATSITVLTPALPAGRHSLSVTTAAGTTTGGTYTVRTLEAEVLRLVNAARAKKRKCGSTTYKAVPALRANATLAKVAAAHSADMAAKSYFSHYSRNGDSPFDRMKDAGYRYSSAGENIAAGYRTPSSVVNAWLKSKGHCKNIMKKSYKQLGVGHATGGLYGSYWTQDFGTPR